MQDQREALNAATHSIVKRVSLAFGRPRLDQFPMSNEDMKSPQTPEQENGRQRQSSGEPPARHASSRRWTVYGAIGLLILCAPVALLGAVLPVNKYAAFDPALTGMVDCDGPIGVLILTIPSLIVCFGIALVMRTSAYRGRLALIVALIALAMAVSVVPNTVRAVIEMSGSNHRDVCG